MIDPRLLRFFIAVAEELSFSKAAKRLHISQSPLSYAIKQLEQQLNATLFERTTRQVSLTAAGQALYEEAITLLLRHGELKQRIQHVQAGYEGELHIGFVGSMLFRGLAELLENLKTAYPKVEYRLQELNSSRQLLSIERGDIDLGFIHQTSASPNIQTIDIWHEPFMLCVPLKNNEQIKNITLEELKNKEFIFFSHSASTTYYELLILQCAEAGFYPKVSYQAPHWLSVISMVAQNLGVSIVPSSLAKSGINGVRFFPLSTRHKSLSQLAYQANSPSVLIQTQVHHILDFYNNKK